MHSRRTPAGGLALVLILVLAVACDKEEPVMLVRVETGCVYDGPTELDSGVNHLRLADEGVGVGGPVEVEVLALQETSYEEVATHFGSDNARFPAPGTHVVQRLVLGAETRAEAESVQMPSGTYALVCYMGDSNGVPFAQVTATDQD